MAMYVFDCVHVWGAGHVCGAKRPYGQKLGDERNWGPARGRTPQKNNSGTPNAQRRGKKDPQSPYEICRPDFSS